MIDEKSEEEGLAFVRYMKCLPLLEEVDEGLRSVCHQRPTAGSEEEEYNVDGEGGVGGAVAAGEQYGDI